MLTPFDPFRQIDRLSQLFGHDRGPAMPLDAYRQGERFVVQLDLPGVDPASIDLTVQNDVLTVRAERQAPEADGQEWVVGERPHGWFSRQLSLGEGLDTDHVEAGYEHGVLTVSVPVAEASKPRKVEITSGGENKAIEGTSQAA